MAGLLDVLAENTVEIDGGYETPCWRWTRPLNADGYGTISWGGRKWLVHRLAVVLRDGDLEDERDGEWVVVDHKCHNRWCWRPEHLEPVTNRENTLRGWSKTAIAHVTGRCQRDHDLNDPKNLYYRKDKPGYGYCKTCVLDRGRARKAAARVAVGA